jgi:hypothetical protein
MDETAEVREKGRSAVLRQLASDFLRQRREQEIEARYERAYKGVEDPLGKDFEGERTRVYGPPSESGRDLALHLRVTRRAPPGAGALSTEGHQPAPHRARGLDHLLRPRRPSEVPVGIEEGLKQESVVNLDQVQTVDQGSLHHFVGTVGAAKMAAVCRALAVVTGCGN